MHFIVNYQLKKTYLVNYHFLMQKVLEADREDLLTYVIKFLIHEYIQTAISVHYK